MEERVAGLEINVEHIQKDVVTALAINMEKKFAEVAKSFGALRTAGVRSRVVAHHVCRHPQHHGSGLQMDLKDGAFSWVLNRFRARLA